MTFTPGRTILYRNTRMGRASLIRPVRVLSDDDRGLLTWTDRGVPLVSEVAADGRGMRSMPFTEWITQDYRHHHGSWQGPGILCLFPPRGEYSVWWFWTEDGEFDCWYVNLEEHAIRWDDGELAGVDVIDQDLDVIVRPDHTWEWKDEDEFTERLALPEHYWVKDEQAVRAEGRRVIKIAEAQQFPFDGTWTDFRPDPQWQIPTALPTGWDRPLAPRN